MWKTDEHFIGGYRFAEIDGGRIILDVSKDAERGWAWHVDANGVRKGAGIVARGWETDRDAAMAAAEVAFRGFDFGALAK